jgi:hypothetical protein
MTTPTRLATLLVLEDTEIEEALRSIYDRRLRMRNFMTNVHSIAEAIDVDPPRGSSRHEWLEWTRNNWIRAEDFLRSFAEHSRETQH